MLKLKSLKMDLGYAIRLIRNELDITQQELSEMSGVSQAALSQIEKNQKRPGDQTLKKICRALDVPECLIYILGMTGKDVPESRKAAYNMIFPSIRTLAMQFVSAEELAIAV